MRLFILLAAGLLPFFSCDHKHRSVSEGPNRLVFQIFENSGFIGNKKVSIYLPEGYDQQAASRYQVLYMMDGQNLFADTLAYGGPGWRLDEVLDSLTATKQVAPTIVVAIAHAGSCRFAEYMPEKVFTLLDDSTTAKLANRSDCDVYSDNFLKFLVQELKPHIDSTFRTLPDAAHTFLGGSSMGGLISMYGLCEYPEIFGGAMCMSTHWPVSLTNATPEAGWFLVEYLDKNFPIGKKWYFDRGTEYLDAFYGPYQDLADSVINAQNGHNKENTLSLVFNGHAHNESYWNSRLPKALSFLLKP